MPTLITKFNWGSALTNFNPELVRQLDEVYTDTANAVNTKVSKYYTNGTSRPHVDPPASNIFNRNFEIGDIYVRTDTDSAWIMTSRTTDIAVTWTLIT
jgi:hypothetical protein